MDLFWEIVMGWSPFGQGLFLLIFICVFATVVERLAHYLAVILRGWPDPFVQKGSLTVSHGEHEIHVPTVMEPKTVWVSFDGAVSVSVCQGDTDRVGVTIDKEGFILRLNIKSAERDLRWRAEF